MRGKTMTTMDATTGQTTMTDTLTTPAPTARGVARRPLRPDARRPRARHGLAHRARGPGAHPALLPAGCEVTRDDALTALVHALCAAGQIDAADALAAPTTDDAACARRVTDALAAPALWATVAVTAWGAGDYADMTTAIARIPVVT